MLKLTRKFVALLLALMMTVSTVTVPALAEETNPEVMVTATPVPVEEPAEEPTEETVEVVIEELTEEPVEESIEESTEEPVEESVEESAEEPVEESIEESTEEPVEEPAEEPTEESTEESTEKSTEEPIEESTEENEAAPVTMTLTANAAYAFVGRDAVVLTVTVAGGTAPYTVSMKEEGVEIQSIVVEAEGSIELTYAPAAYGEHVVEVAVADAAEQIASGNVTVIAAESDSETEAEWTEAFENLALSGDWREDIVAIANTQVGYRESERDFVIKEDGEKQGYTRYGDWYGASYSEWCAMFVSFCIHYAGISESEVPYEANCKAFKNALAEFGAYEDDENSYVPQKGDLIFFAASDDEGNTPKHIGIVEKVSGSTVHVIEGNSHRSVERTEYALTDSVIVGYANMTKLMERAGKLETAVEVTAADLMAALNVPEYTEETLWTTLDEVIAAKQAEGTLEAYLAEIAAAQDAVNALTEEEKAALETEFAAQQSFAKLLTVKVTFDALAAEHYVDFDGELWVLFETRLALMDMDALIAAYNDISVAMTAVYSLPEAELAIFSEKYAAELDFMMQFYAAINEKAGTPATMSVENSWFNPNAVESASYFNVIKENHYSLAPGATEATIILNNAAGNDRKEVHVFEVDASEVDVLAGYYGVDELIAAYDADPEAYASSVRDADGKWVKETKAEQLTKTVDYYEDLGYKVVGAMNTALAYDSNVPYGYFVFEGKVLTTPADHKGASTYLAVNKDGSCELRSMSTGLTGNERFAIPANFGWLVKDGVLQSKTVERTSSDASRSMIGIKADGTLMFVHCDGRNAPVSSGLSNYEMGELMIALGCVNAVNCDGGGSSTFVSKRAGDSAPVMRSVPSDGSERPTINSVILAIPGNKLPGTLHSVEIVSDYDYIVPNSAYEMSAVAIDTTAAEMEVPEGGVWTLSDDSFGTIENGVFTSNGKLGTVTVTFTVNGKSDEVDINVVNPMTVRFAQENTVLPYGKSTPIELEMYATEDELVSEVYFTLNDFEFEISDEDAGVLDLEEGTFAATQNESKHGVDIYALYKHDPNAEELQFHIEFGKGSEVLAGWDFEDGMEHGFMGFVDAKQWSYYNNVNNTLVGSDPLAGQFNKQISLDTFVANRNNGQVRNGNYALGVTMDFTDAAFASWSYDVIFNVEGVKVLRDVANGLNATTLGMWVYIPEGAAGLSFQSQLYVKNANGSLSCKQDHFMFTTVDGVRKNLNSATEEDIPANRWVYASIDISKYDYLQTPDPYDETNSRSPSFIRSYVKPTTAAKLTFYIDDITLDYSPAVPDRNEPIISDISYAITDEPKQLDLEGMTVIASDNASFSAAVAENTVDENGKKRDNASGLDTATAQIYMDGNKVDTQVIGGTMSTVENIVLTAGDHKITFEIADKEGNVAQKSVVFSVDTASEESLIYFGGHNDSGDKPVTDSIYYIDIKTTDAGKVEYLETNIQLNTANTWELDQMIVAPGFEVEYIQADLNRGVYGMDNTDIHSVENVVAIMLMRTEDCDLTGEQTLLSLPVRVWSWDGVNNITGQPIDPETQFATGNNPIVSIDYEVLFGYVETSDGGFDSVYGSGSVETMINDSVNKWHYHDDVLTVLNKEATCQEAGYANRTYCESCQSVIDWGDAIAASGHSYKVCGEQLACDCGKIHGGNGIVWVNDYTEAYVLIADKLVTGWQMVEGDVSGWTYADPATKQVVIDANKVINKITYFFNEDGITAGAWVINSNGARYSYGPDYLKREWKEIDGASYYFGTDSYMYTGIRAIAVNRNNVKEGYKVYDFGTDGRMVNDYADFSGIISTDGDGMYYMENGVSVYAGLMLIDGDYYYARTGGQLVCGKAYWITKNNDLLPVQYYTFGEDGKMIDAPVVEPDEPVVPEVKNGIVKEDGKLYWYVDGVKTYAGLIYLDTDNDGVQDAYYYARTGGEIVCGKAYWITKNNDLLPVKYYIFGEDGKMVDAPTTEPEPEEPVVPEVKNGIVEEGGKKYWYVNGVKTYAGLMYLDTDQDGAGDAYYYARTGGEIVCGKKYWITKNNDLLPVQYYTFGEDGKMINPPVK